MINNSINENSFQVYMKDLKNYPLFSPSEEKKAFEIIDFKEKKLIKLLFDHEQINDELLEKLDIFKNLDENIEKSFKFFINGSPNIEEIFRFVKYSDEGRNWLKWAYVLSQKTDKKIWANKLKTLNDSILADKSRFATHNLRLVISIAKNVRKAGASHFIPDMVQEGNIGLIKSIDRFDQSRGYRFSTYASWWIRHYINRYLTEKERTIRIPVHLSDKLYQFSKFKQKYEQEGKEISIEVISKEMNISVEKTLLLQEVVTSKIMSFDAPVKDDSLTTYIDNFQDENAISPYDGYVASIHKKAIEKALTYLDKKESEILRWRFGIEHREMTLQEIGEVYKLSRERIRQIEERALNKLRHGSLRSMDDKQS